MGSNDIKDNLFKNYLPVSLVRMWEIMFNMQNRLSKILSHYKNFIIVLEQTIVYQDYHKMRKSNVVISNITSTYPPDEISAI